jgi:hypothetical protein
MTADPLSFGLMITGVNIIVGFGCYYLGSRAGYKTGYHYGAINMLEYIRERFEEVQNED